MIGKLHSKPHNAEPQHFLGCGWSFWLTLDFPCLSSELDDQIFMMNKTFEIAASTALPPNTESQLALCDSSVEIFGQSNGRWVREPFPTDRECPVRLTIDTNEKTRGFKDIETRGFDLFLHDGAHPHCYHRDSIDRIGLSCARHDTNCHLIDESSYWMNSVARVPKWMGVWQERRCTYVEFTNWQLQQCIGAKKITNITTSGKSVADLLLEYIN